MLLQAVNFSGYHLIRRTLQSMIENVELRAIESTQEKIYCWQMKIIKRMSCLSYYWICNKYNCNLLMIFFCLHFLSLSEVFITVTCTQEECVVILELVFQ